MDTKQRFIRYNSPKVVRKPDIFEMDVELQRDDL